MSSPGCHRAPSRPYGDVIVPCAGHCSDTCQPASVWAAAVAGKRKAATSAAQSPRFIGGDASSSRLGSEDLGAPGVPVPAEERVGALKGAVSELFRAAGAGERGKGNAAEVRRAERLGGECDVGVLVGTRSLAILELPAAFVPRTELVVDVEHDRPVGA